MPNRHSNFAPLGPRPRRTSPSCRGGASSLLRITPGVLPRFAHAVSLPAWIDRAMRMTRAVAPSED